MAALLQPGKALFNAIVIGSKGPEVTKLHSQLLQLHTVSEPKESLDAYLSPSELTTAAFGPRTRIAVLEFQRKNQSLLASPPSGIFDRETSAVLHSRLLNAGIHLDHPKVLFVAGSVYFADGSTSTELVVTIVDRDLNEDKFLISVAVRADGFFSASYSRKDCLRGNTQRRPTLVPKVFLRKKQIYKPEIDDLEFEAPNLTLLNIRLEARAPSAPTADEFTQMLVALDSVLPPLPTKAPAKPTATEPAKVLQEQERSSTPTSASAETTAAIDPKIGDRIRRLREDNEMQDLSYLTRLKSTSFSKPNLTKMVLAHRLANTAQKEHQIQAPSELFYALLATDTPQNFTSRDPANVGATELDLKTPTKPLLYQLALLNKSIIARAVDTALFDNIASSNLKRVDISGLWDRLSEIARGWIQVQPTLEDQIWDMIKDFLETGKEEALREVLGGDNVEGDLMGFLKRLGQAFVADTATSAATFRAVSEGPMHAGTSHLPATAVIERIAASHSKSRRDLARMDRSTLEGLIIAVLPTEARQDSADAIKNTAAAVENALEKDHPTAVFGTKLRRFISVSSSEMARFASLSTESSTQDVSNPVKLGHDSLSIDARAVSNFLSANPNFDFLTSKVELSKSAPAPRSTDSASIAKVQRVFKLAPTFDKSQALLDLGFHSATHIARIGRPQFLSAISKSSSFTPAEAVEVFDRAANIQLATALLAGDLQGAGHALLPAGLSEPLPPTKLEAVTKNFPNIASLFQIGDVCSCADCMTVYSPSAYLVDVLEFLQNRGVLDSVGGPNNGLTARDVLFKRRHDLADLDLSCNNTNITLPYIDLVCELLEDFVAPDGLSPGAFEGTTTKGKISDELLKFLRGGLNLPFTPDALVSDTYNGGYRTVRDKTVLVSLSPSEQKVRVLRQTYGDAPVLAASPAYLNTIAYTRLSESTYLSSLPFNLALEECRAYLGQLGVPRTRLMRALAHEVVTPSAYDIALEGFDLSSAEGKLITTDDPDNQYKYWNTGMSTNPVNVVKNVERFVSIGRIQYTDLQALLSAVEWLNPPDQPPPNPGVEKVGVMYIRHLDNTCSLKAKEIQGLRDKALDRFHRFLRLWRALTRETESGWSINNLDRAIAAPRLGDGNLNAECVSTISAISATAKMFGARFKTTVADIIDIFSGLRLVPPLDSVQPSPVTYSSIFLNPIANGPVDPAFEIEAIALNGSTPFPPAAPRLSEHTEYISRCLGVPVSDIELIIKMIAAQEPDPILSLRNLSTMYAVVSICRRLQISVPDYVLFSYLTGISPLKTVSQLSTFTTAVTKMQALELSALDVEFITQPPALTPSSRDIPDEKVLEILANLQTQYSAVESANESPFESTLEASENQNASLALMSQLPGIGQPNLANFRRMLDDGLSAVDGAKLVDDKLQPQIGDAAAAAIKTAQASLANETDSEKKEMRKLELVKVVSETLSAHFAAMQRATALEGTVVGRFEVSPDLVAILLHNIASLEPLLDKKLAAGPVSKINFPEQFKALRLLHRLSFTFRKFELPTPEVLWLLRNASALGWANLAEMPSGDGDLPISWDLWASLVDYIAVVKAAAFPAVKNPADKETPFKLTGLLDLVLATGTDLALIDRYFSTLTSQDPANTSALTAHFGFRVEDFKRILNLQKLDTAATVLRTSNMPPAAAISLSKTETPSAQDADNARKALKARYVIESDWLEVLKTIQDPLRLRKRDSLVDYLLAYNQPSLTSATDLSELLLIDVQMGTETTTSRIFQAHLSVQQFVQRLLMGLEPTPLVPDDPAWTHWTEMSQYRLWEANKKVFLYPETWIEPDLRDNKSELYVALEDSLKKQPMMPSHVERVVAEYLKQLDHIADLQVMSSFYEVPTSTLHVFARTKGGNPREYYHRTLVFEAVWSPWEKLDGVEITGNHLLGFKRYNRLTLAWPIFSYEQDPRQQTTAPPIPDPNNLPESTEPRMQRLKIQLAVSVRDPDTGKWSARILTEDGVFWPGPGGEYVEASRFSNFLEERINLHYWDLGGELGQMIVVCESAGGGRLKEGLIGESVFGAFSVTGCKGYPEPYNFGSSSQGRETGRFDFLAFPYFRNTDFETQRFRKARQLSTSSTSDLAIKTLLERGDFVTALGKEYGRFVVTYPTQPTIIDRAFFGLQLYAVGRGSSNNNLRSMEMVYYHTFSLSQGLFLPYFVADSSTRGYAITPGYGSAIKGDTNFRTASDTFEFFGKALKLALKYIDIYFTEVNRDITRLRERINGDEDYQTLKKELLAVYVNADVPEEVQIRKSRADIASFYHPLVCFLRSKLYSNGISALLARKTQLTVTDFDFKKAYAPTEYIRPPYPREELDFSLSGPYAEYNWELFFHLPFQIAARFSADQQFEQARNWYHYIFNPQGADMEDPETGPGKATAPQKKYWQTKPFFKMQASDYLQQRIDSILHEIGEHPSGFSLGDALKAQVQLWRANPFSPHVIARARPVAYQMAIVLKYTQNLFDWGDRQFRQLTRESITQALTLYTVVEKLLGAKPRNVKPAVEVPVRTYNELAKDIDLVGNALLSLENLIPDLGSLPHGGQELPQPPAPPLTSLYFGIPPNTKMLELWDLVADRLFKIRHSQDINGNFVSLPLTSPPIDPGALVKALASGASLADIVNGLNAPLPHYRFSYVLERAQMLTQHVIYLGQQLLSFLEKRDVERLSRLRARSELTVLASVRGVKVAAIAQNTAAVKALEAAKAVAQVRKTYYTELLKMPINPDELMSMMMHLETAIHDVRMQSGHRFASIANLLPAVSVGVQGFGGSPQATVSWGGSNLAASISSSMSAIASQRSTADKSALMFSTVAGYTRRTAEWDFQLKLADAEITHIGAQLVAANASGAMLAADLVAHNTASVEAASAEAYLRTKFTNTELFDWAVSKVSTLYFQTFGLAFDMAKKAERCLAFELGDFSAATNIVQYGIWDNLKSGLLSGDELQLDLNRLQSFYTDHHKRELDLTKPVSLLRIDPAALLTLRSTGTCIFSVPESLFDLDTPGHYFRRTTTISLSIPCVVGPYVPVSATVRLLSSRYRARPTRPSSYPESPPGGDDRFQYNVIPPPTMTVASMGANDAGVHNLTPDDPRYLPFEHAGVLGTYSITLPPNQQFSYDTIADVVMTISYTARDGGSGLRKAATPVPTEGQTAVAIRTTFPAEWNALRAGRPVEPVVAGKRQMPYWAIAQGRMVEVGETVWCTKQEVNGLVVAGQDLTLVDEGGVWKTTLEKGKVRYGEKVTIEWKDPEERVELDELVCVVMFDVDSAQNDN